MNESKTIQDFKKTIEELEGYVQRVPLLIKRINANNQKTGEKESLLLIKEKNSNSAFFILVTGSIVTCSYAKASGIEHLFKEHDGRIRYAADVKSNLKTLNFGYPQAEWKQVLEWAETAPKSGIPIPHPNLQIEERLPAVERFINGFVREIIKE
jgi:hypothetical protein